MAGGGRGARAPSCGSDAGIGARKAGRAGPQRHPPLRVLTVQMSVLRGS